MILGLIDCQCYWKDSGQLSPERGIAYTSPFGAKSSSICKLILSVLPQIDIQRSFLDDKFFSDDLSIKSVIQQANCTLK
jgi:hypothetical protein